MTPLYFIYMNVGWAFILLCEVLDQNDKIMKHKMCNQFNWKYKQAARASIVFRKNEDINAPKSSFAKSMSENLLCFVAIQCNNMLFIAVTAHKIEFC